MLIGNYSTKLSTANRVAVPNSFRKELGKTFIIAKWYENCLVVVSSESWKELLKRITGQVQFVTQSVRDTDRFILGSAFELTTDAQGRTVLPKQLIEFAKLHDEVVFIGLGDRVEVWSKTEWEEREKYVSENAAQLLETIANNGEKNS